MNLADVMDELGDRLAAIDGLRVHAYWVDRVNVPAAVIGWPDPLEFDATMGRGTDRVTLPLFVIVGRVDAKAARNAAALYAAGSGPTSIKQAVERRDPPPTSYQTARVQRATFGGITVAGTEYLAVTFDVDVTGPGG